MTSMRGAVMSEHFRKGMGNQENSKKSTEAFVQWKEPMILAGHSRSLTVKSPKSRGERKQPQLSNTTASSIAPLEGASLSRRLRSETGVVHSPRGSPVARESRQATYTSQNGRSDAGIAASREQVSRLPLNADLDLLEASMNRTRSANGYGGGGIARASPERSVVANRVPSHSAQNILLNYALGSSGSQMQAQRQRKVQWRASTSEGEGKSFQEGRSMATSVRGHSDEEQDSCVRSETNRKTEEEEDGFLEPEDNHGEEENYFSNPSEQQQRQRPSSYNNDTNDNSSASSEKVGDFADAVEEAAVEDAKHMTVFHELMYADESTKRRKRRQAQAAREREGERRRRQGLPRNFLLVDEYTGKSYGTGVGDWRKELMLMSRKLDAAIGNINQQPQAAVTEIAEWIQHTWEYSSPVKFEYVKEVVARGVTLRRGDLWKRIRNNESEPEEVTDRTWRTLRRLLESSATMKKSESCSRANASRVNFGRTGPLGEVGVRQRLRRFLRRSPEPEEIRFEMARDKGYGGRSHRKKNTNTVMLGSEGDAQVIVARDSGKTGMLHGEGSGQDGAHDKENSGHQKGNAAEGTSGESSHEVGAMSNVVAISIEQIAQHPFVMQMMQRLQALEGRQSIPIVHDESAHVENAQLLHTREEVQVAKVQNCSQNLQCATEATDGQGGEAPRRPGRPRKKAK